MRDEGVFSGAVWRLTGRRTHDRPAASTMHGRIRQYQMLVQVVAGWSPRHDRGGALGTSEVPDLIPCVRYSSP